MYKDVYRYTRKYICLLPVAIHPDPPQKKQLKPSPLCRAPRSLPPANVEGASTMLSHEPLRPMTFHVAEFLNPNN